MLTESICGPPSQLQSSTINHDMNKLKLLFTFSIYLFILLNLTLPVIYNLLIKNKFNIFFVKLLLKLLANKY